MFVIVPFLIVNSLCQTHTYALHDRIIHCNFSFQNQVSFIIFCTHYFFSMLQPEIMKLFLKCFISNDSSTIIVFRCTAPSTSSSLRFLITFILNHFCVGEIERRGRQVSLHFVHFHQDFCVKSIPSALVCHFFQSAFVFL